VHYPHNFNALGAFDFDGFADKSPKCVISRLAVFSHTGPDSLTAASSAVSSGPLVCFVVECWLAR
jgi:hypothetical protein